MATKKVVKASKKVSPAKEVTVSQELKRESKNKASFFSKETLTKVIDYRASKTFYLVLLLLGLAGLAFLKKDWLIAATVNGIPVSNYELQSKLNSQFREQTLTQMINEKLILQEARNKGVVVTEKDIDQKIADLEKNVGGAEVLNSLLSQQGQSRNSIRQQLKVQMAIEKLYQTEATVSGEEVDQFVAQNPDQLQATDSAKQKEEAENLIKQQKLSQIFNQKFQEIKQAAKIQIF